MAQAYILNSGSIVRDDNWEDVQFSITTGYVSRFTKSSTGVTYIHVRKSEFRASDRIWFEGGYYPENEFLRYIATRDIKYINPALKYGHKSNHQFIKAEENDIITTKMINVYFDSLNSLPRLISSSFPFNPNLDYSGVNSVKIPDPSVVTEIIDQVTSNSTAISFINSNKDQIVFSQVLTEEEDQKKALEYLGLTAIVMTNIIRNVFSIFPNQTQYNNLINAQKNEWSSSSDPIFSETSTLESIKSYFDSLLIFYKMSYRNSIFIDQAIDQDKMFYLALPLTAKSLSFLNIEIKKSIIDHLIDNKLNYSLTKEDEEEFIIRIINSFAYDLDIIEINAFLEWLLTEKETVDRYSDPNHIKYDTKYRTYYEVLYLKMSSPLNITVATAALTNWLFESNWQPTDTRGLFTKAIYTLWIISKYNPYTLDDNPLLKENSIGMITRDSNDNLMYELEPEVPNDPITPDNPGQDIQLSAMPPNPEPLYYYTKYTAFEQTEENVIDGTRYSYFHKYDEAAPILINYESNKTANFYIDNHDFIFSNNKIIVIKEVLAFKQDNLDSDYLNSREYGYARYGTYDIFQPITLSGNDTTKIETKIPIPLTDGATLAANGDNINSVVPMFMLMYVDDAGDRSDAETVFGYIVDGILTLSGIGNLTKFRHLTKLSKLQYVKRIIGGVEFTSGMLSYLTSFIGDCNANDEFCKRIKAFTFWLEMASLSADAITEYMLRKAARNVKNQSFPNDFDHTPTKEKIDSLANAVDKAAEIQRFLDSIASTYPQLKNKLETLRVDLGTNGDDIIFEFIDGLDLDEGTEVLEILNNNIMDSLNNGQPDWLDNVTDIAKARRLARAINMFRNIIRKVKNEPFQKTGNKWKGFSLNRWEQQPDKSWVDSGVRLHSDQDIYDMIYSGLSLDPKITEVWVEDIIVKAFRGSKTKTKPEIIGDKRNIILNDPDYGPESQKYLGELGVASQLGNRIPPPNGLLWCFPDYNAFLNFKDVIKRRLLERYGVDDIITDIHITGSVHTKKIPPPTTNVGPPDIDVVIYMSLDQIKAMYQKRIKHIERCVESKILDKKGNLLHNKLAGENLIKDFKKRIDAVDSPDFDIKKPIGSQNFRTIETNANDKLEVRNLKEILNLIKRNKTNDPLFDNELSSMLEGLNLTDSKMDLKIFPLESKPTELRPISQVTL
ncbi:hypothetical protein ACFO3O_18855 [Dokdonia ponticola]|uniref:Uncharacterized protein n=1 Tax=Dokdonia ponticola TaxID=2041041 RepID=A0ABV9I1F3_9FLAO